MDIYTLQDFLTLTKGQEYLIAIGAMILFSIVWLFLDSRPKKRGPLSSKRQFESKGHEGGQR